MGGFVAGDAYPKVLFENPGHGCSWIRVRLVGVKSNRAAIGARIQVRVAGPDGRGRTIYRDVGSGGSFGASPLTQQIGLGRGARIETLEVLWPTSGARQAFRNLRVDQSIEIREGESRYRLRPLRTASRADRPPG
jgi:hypothetical protein